MRRVILAALITVLALNMSASADRVWVFQPTLPQDGTTAWAVEMQVRFDQVNVDPIQTMMSRAADGEFDAMFLEMQEAIRALEEEVFRTTYHLSWDRLEDPTLRRFTLESSSEYPNGMAIVPSLPFILSGVIDQNGNWMELYADHLGVEPEGFSLGGVAEDVFRSVIVPLPEHSVFVGETWTQPSSRNIFLADEAHLPGELTGLPVDHDYTLLGVEMRNGTLVAHVQHTSHFRYEGHLPVDHPTHPKILHVQQQTHIEADLWVDTSTGLVMEGSQTVQVGGYVAYLPVAATPDAIAELLSDRRELPETTGEPYVVENYSATLLYHITQLN